MTEKKDLLAFCGFDCGDCLGHTGAIARAAENFKKILNRYQFRRTAECVFDDKIEDYKNFYKTLEFMCDLRCPLPCRKREDDSISCPIRTCCLEKGYFACHECPDFETCEELSSFMRGLHSHSVRQNLRAIREMGLENWLKNGKRHHYWDTED